MLDPHRQHVRRHSPQLPSCDTDWVSGFGLVRQNFWPATFQAEHGLALEQHLVALAVFHRLLHSVGRLLQREHFTRRRLDDALQEQLRASRPHLIASRQGYPQRK